MGSPYARKMVAILSIPVACLWGLSAASSVAAPPRGAVLYSVAFSAENTVTSESVNTYGGLPDETCPRATISLSKKLKLASRLYIAQPRDSAEQVAAASRSFRNPWASTGRVPTTGQLSVAVKLGPTAEGCATGENLPPASCNLTIPVRSMQFNLSTFSWYVQVPHRARQESPCMQLATSEPTEVGGHKDKLLRPLLLRRKAFTFRESKSGPWGEGTARLTWSARFTPIVRT